MRSLCLSSWFAVLGLTACATVFKPDPKAPIPNFYKVEDGIYRGGQPDVAGVLYLKSLGIKTVIDLNDDLDSWQKESINLSMNYINLAYVPMSGFLYPKAIDVDKALAALAAKDNRPIYIHCLHGQDRTGLMIGIYRVEVEGWSKEKAHEEMMEHGFHPELVPLEAYFWMRAKK